jgi:hypothetical protein
MCVYNFMSWEDLIFNTNSHQYTFKINYVGHNNKHCINEKKVLLEK